jgi:hypothetical protein
MELAFHARVSMIVLSNGLFLLVYCTFENTSTTVVADHRDGECVGSIATAVGCCSVCVSALVLVSVVIIVMRNDFYV